MGQIAFTICTVAIAMVLLGLTAEIQMQTVTYLSELTAHLDQVEARFLAGLLDLAP